MGELRVLEAKRVSQDAIDLLESILEEARAGKIEAVGIVITRFNGGINCCHSETDQVGALIGATARLQHRLLEKIERD